MQADMCVSKKKKTHTHCCGTLLEQPNASLGLQRGREGEGGGSCWISCLILHSSVIFGDLLV